MTICDNDFYVFNGDSLYESGIYTAMLMNEFGCDATVVLTLIVNEVPQLSFSATICAGEVYPFNGEFLTEEGIYVGFFQTTEGCDSTVILDLRVTSVDTGVSVQGSTMSAQSGYQDYQWINCDTGEAIAGATDSVYTTSFSGNYAVEVTQNNCIATSSCVFVQVVSTYEPFGQNEWTLQPNPASFRTLIVFSEDTKTELWLEIHDTAGRKVHSQLVAAGIHQVELDLGALPDGLLMVRLANERGVSTKSLVKTR